MAIGGIHLGGRPVTSTNGVPDAITRSTTALVRADGGSFGPIKVPSTSDATSKGCRTLTG
ncbi:hypothetical protein GCM10023321_64260 [Pseudonocardia eucalypti]|uniref:Uncharacterized protein n=1 Tax=Pseudonocardia eucalypti TaxID=648755 RepID=A0ABP9QXT6_9PSEU